MCVRKYIQMDAMNTSHFHQPNRLPQVFPKSLKKPFLLVQNFQKCIHTQYSNLFLQPKRVIMLAACEFLGLVSKSKSKMEEERANSRNRRETLWEYEAAFILLNQ